MKDCCDNCKTGDPCCTTNEAKTSSIDGKALYDFLQKRFKMSKSKAIATMKQHKMDMSFLKKESVTEVDRRAKSQIFSEWNKFEKEYGNFFKAVVKLGKVNTKVTGDKTDEKIFLTDFTRNVGKFYSLMQSWVRGQNESVDESDLPITTKKGKTITAVHKKSGKEIVVVDTPASRKKLKRMGFEVNEGFSSSLVKKAVDIAKKMSGNMTGAVKKIEKIKKGLSKDKQVTSALRASNESVNEAVEPQGNMAKIAKVVKDKQYTKLSGVLIDGQSANLLMKLFNAVSDKDKEKMNKMNARLLTTVIKKLWSRVNLKLPI